MKKVCSLRVKIWIITGLLMTSMFCFGVDRSLPIPKVDPLIPPITQTN